jgi:hypothetical protein
MATTNVNFIDERFGSWIKEGNLLVNLYSLEMGFKETERSRRDVWDYIEWRETVLVGPPDSSCRIATFI